MKYILTLIGLVLIVLNLNAQQKPSDTVDTNILIQEGMLLSVEGLDLEKFEIIYEELEILEDLRINLDSLTKDNLICFAIDQCDIELLKFLIENGANVSTTCDSDDAITYVTYCIEEGVEMTKLMLANGSNMNGVDQDNDPFLSYAIGYDNYELVKYLIEIGSDRKHKDSNMGCFPIHSCESVDMLKILINNGFEVNEICDNGRNLLHFAARNNHTEIAQYLVENNLVDIDLKDVNGETPLDYALKFHNTEIEKIIKSKL